MIERLARRIGGFASSTALRWANTALELPKEAIPVPAPRKPLGSRKGAIIVGAAAAGAVALASSNSELRRKASAGLRQLAKQVRATNGSGNGAKSLSERTKRELYRMAKRKNIPGRASMTKEELERALTD
jgi:hypothetical protein